MRGRVCRIRSRGPAWVCLAVEGDLRERDRERFGHVKDVLDY